MTDPIILEARKRSSDPAQEHLRSQKDVWNAATSSLLSKLRYFKSAINGYGSAKAGLPKVQIIEAFPAEVGSYLQHLADEYLSVIRGAENILTEQENYAGTRRRRQEKHEPAAPVSNQSAFQSVVQNADDGLVTEASWVGSRFWAKHFGLSGENKPFLKSLINSGEIANDALEDIENILSSSDPNAGFTAFNLMYRTTNGSVTNMVEQMKMLNEGSGRELPASPKSLPSGPPVVSPANDVVPQKEAPPAMEAEAPAALPPPKVDPEQDAIARFTRYIQDYGNSQIVYSFVLSKNPDLSKELNKIDAKLSGKSSMSLMNKLALYRSGKMRTVAKFEFIVKLNEVLQVYDEALQICSSMFGKQLSTFEEMLPLINQNGSDTNDAKSLIMTPLRKFWLENKLDFLRSSRELDDAKIRAIKKSESCQKALDDFLNLIEKPGARKSQIEPKFKEFAVIFGKLIEEIVSIARIHNGLFKDEKASKTRKDVILHMVDNGNITQLLNFDKFVLNPPPPKDDGDMMDMM